MKKYILYFIGILLGLFQTSRGQEKNLILGTIPFELTKHNNISITAILNERDTVRLMFHTGADAMTLIKNSTRHIKSINWDEETEVRSWGGKSKARYSASNSLQIGNFKWDSLPIWENNNSGPTTDGKIGPNLFEGKVIDIDFDKSLITIYKTLPEKVKSYQKSKLAYDEGSMFIVGIGTIKNTPLPNKFLIHSGYGGTILYDDEFVRVNKLGEKLEILKESELRDSYGNVLKTKKAVLPLFAIGNNTFHDIPIGFFEGSIGKQKMSVIGGDLLKRFNLIFAADRSTIYLKPNNYRNTPYSS